jgi:hypothetical protein
MGLKRYNPGLEWWMDVNSNDLSILKKRLEIRDIATKVVTGPYTHNLPECTLANHCSMRVHRGGDRDDIPRHTDRR